MLFTVLLIHAYYASLSMAVYVLKDSYTPSTFLDMFNFFTDHDPNHGYVTYVDQRTAQSTGLIRITDNTIYIGVDHINIASESGRSSVRLISKESYNHGLFIADITHMPGGICGIWSAFWMLGPHWPSGGEIDIIEGINQQSQNDMTLHTSPDCSIINTGTFTGRLNTTDCYGNAPGQANNAGCRITASASNTYGTGFNTIKGGVYATEWTSSYISIYFFPRGQVPGDIDRNDPDVSTWGPPLAQFQGNCDIDAHFQNQQIVINTNFCGDWAGSVWSSGSCASKASSCTKFVRSNPAAFTEAYWSIRSVKVYQLSSNPATDLPPMSTRTVTNGLVLCSCLCPAIAPLSSPTLHTTSMAVEVPITSAYPAEQTVSALDLGAFPNSGELQTEGVKQLGYKRHVLQHRYRHDGASRRVPAVGIRT